MEDPVIYTKSDEIALERGYIYDTTKAYEVKEFFERYGVITETCFGGNVGDPAKIIPWQWERVIKPMYSWFKPDGKTPRWNQVLVMCPKKQSKSNLIALMSLYELVRNPSANIRIISSKVSQSKVCFDFIANVCRYGPLKKYVRKKGDKATKDNPIWIRDNIETIEYTNPDGIKSLLEIMVASVEGSSGPSLSLCLWDEFCDLPAHSSHAIWDKVKGATAARNGIHCMVSHPQYTKTTVGFEKYSFAKSILSGEIVDLHFMPVIYEIPEDATCACGNCPEGFQQGWRCPTWWQRANPSWNVTVPESFYYDTYAEVKNNPVMEAYWRTFHCGQWHGSSKQFLSSTDWSACQESFQESDLYQKRAWLGLDLSRVQDLTSYTIAVPVDDNVYIINRSFTVRKFAEKKEKTDRCPYRKWEAQGHVILCDGDQIDYELVRQHILEDCKRFKVLELRYDPNMADETRIILEKAGVRMLAIPQYPTYMAKPTAYFEQLVIGKRLRHNGSPLMTYCCENAVPRMHGQDQVTIDKSRSTNRVDALISAILACSGPMSMDNAHTDFFFF